MSIRPEKCIAWSPRGLPAPLPLPPGCQTPPGGLTILGVPFGTPSFVDGQLRDRLLEHLQPVTRLPELQDMQLALAMLTRCIVQRPHYLARTTPPCPEVLEAYTKLHAHNVKCAAMMTSLGIRGDRHDVVHFHDRTVPSVAHQTRQSITEEVVDAHHFWSSGASQHVSGELSTLCTEAALTLAHPNQAVRWEAAT
eukprot:SM000043S15807  [mRNA]  locus=s43:282285:285104:- [translate_table: standard]